MSFLDAVRQRQLRLVAAGKPKRNSLFLLKMNRLSGALKMLPAMSGRGDESRHSSLISLVTLGEAPSKMGSVGHPTTAGSVQRGPARPFKVAALGLFRPAADLTSITRHSESTTLRRNDPVPPVRGLGGRAVQDQTPKRTGTLSALPKTVSRGSQMPTSMHQATLRGENFFSRHRSGTANRLEQSLGREMDPPHWRQMADSGPHRASVPMTGSDVHPIASTAKDLGGMGRKNRPSEEPLGRTTLSGAKGFGLDRSNPRNNSSGQTLILSGDLILDGRQLGQLVASRQSRNLNMAPAGSRTVNLRATPIQPGLSIPAP